jgi:hypothetical protein
MYEEEWIVDGQYVTKVTYGTKLRTMTSYEDLNPSNKTDVAKNKETLHPEHYTHIHAAALLLKDLEDTCVAIDRKRGIVEV